MRAFLKLFISFILAICLFFLLFSFLLTFNTERLIKLVDNSFLEDLRISPQNITLHYSGIYPGFEIETLEIKTPFEEGGLAFFKSERKASTLSLTCSSEYPT